MATFDWNGWSNWHDLSIEHGFGFVNAPRKPGCYVISAGKPIHRAVGTDEHGILTIGESDVLQRRLGVFASCALTPGAEGHSAGYRFAILKFAKQFPFSELRVRWKMTETKDLAYNLEGSMLMSYLLQHFELPPLNYQFNWSTFNITGETLLEEALKERCEG